MQSTQFHLGLTQILFEGHPLLRHIQHAQYPSCSPHPLPVPSSSLFLQHRVLSLLCSYMLIEIKEGRGGGIGVGQVIVTESGIPPHLVVILSEATH